MKKLVAIAFIGLGLFFVSCHKENVGPRECDKDAPTWNNDSFNQRDIIINDNVTIGNGGSITDPNDDEDGNGKKKGKTIN